MSVNLQFTPIPAFRDNYIWQIGKADSQEIFIVDPGQAAPTLEHISANGLELKGILITHSHPDHIGGINEIREHYPVPVYGPLCKRIPQITEGVQEGSEIELWPNVRFKVLEIPGHLDEHLAYYYSGDAENTPAALVGDTLFSSGCGRMFDGPAPTYKSSLDKLKKLPAETQVYCAHEYTMANLDFAAHIEPNNLAIQQKREHTLERLRRSKCSLPTTIESELATNPFLRCDNEDVILATSRLYERELTNEVETFGALRSLKDRY